MLDKRPNDNNIIITDAINTPIRAAINDFFLSISSTAANKHPVQAPVPGNGTPTNNINPRYPYFSIFSLFFSTFSEASTYFFPNFFIIFSEKYPYQYNITNINNCKTTKIKIQFC